MHGVLHCEQCLFLAVNNCNKHIFVLRLFVDTSAELVPFYTDCTECTSIS